MDPIRVLYAEDERADWELTARHFERQAPHLKLARAESVAEALDQLAAGNVDLVLSDYRLPDGTGLDLLDAVRSRQLPVPVVLVTGSGDADTAVRLLKAGAADYVVKRADYVATLPAVIEGAFRWFRTTDELRRSQVRVLYAEHDPADVEMTQRVFREHGTQIQLDVTWRGVDALQRLRAVAYDLLLLDYRLPDMLGLEVLKILREERIRIPVVVVTGQGDEDTAVQAMKLGASDYILKREGYLTRLPITLENVLGQRRLEDENAALLVLNELTRSISSARESGELVHGVVRGAAELLRADVAVLWLAADGELVPRAWIGLDEAAARALRRPANERLTAQAVVERRVRLDALLAAAPETPPALRAAGHGLAVSLVAGGELSGLLAVGSPAPRRFRSTDERLLTVLADHATVALDNVQLYGQLREQLEELQRTQARLVQTEKLAAMGQILAGVAHELNNPLSVVVGHATLLREELSRSPHAERLQKVEAAANRCARIVKNFLALARQRTPQRERVDIAAVIREAAALLGYVLAVDEVQTSIRTEPDLPFIWADPHQLHQVIVNLIANADHAMRETAPPRRLAITARAARDPDRLVVEVADTGPGIPPPLRDQIFEPFFTTKAPGEGTGLGLSLCRGTIESHGGSLTLVDGPGPGSVFRIELPVTAPPAEAAAAPPPAGRRGPGKAVLVVEDEADVAEVLADLLSADGHHVDVCRDGQAALERLATRTYDLILADMRMPQLDGPGLYRELQRRAPSQASRIVFITGDVLRPETREFLQQVGAPSLNKPFDLEEVRRLVQ